MLFADRRNLHRQVTIASDPIHVPRASRTTCVMKIAIIGAGIGGCSAARFCRQEFKDAEIHVLERTPRVGGRACVFESGGHTYEAGASIVHSRNRYLADFAAEFKLGQVAPPQTRLVLHNGRPVFEGSSFKPLTLAKMLRRYGLGPLRLERWVERFLRKFEHIYELQGRSQAFTSPKKLLAALDPEFEAMVSETLKRRLEQDGFDKRMVEELVAGIVRVNYGQGLDVGVFVGAVALCGSGGKLWAVSGGNHTLAEKLLEASGAKLITDAKVLRIELGQQRYTVEARCAGAERFVEEYDLVFVAAPQHEPLELQIVKGSQNLTAQIARRYQRIFASFYSAPPCHLALHCGSPPAGTILSTSPGFNIGQYNSTGGEDLIWKVFSEPQSELFSKSSLRPSGGHTPTRRRRERKTSPFGRKGSILL
ncbi:unnamed protein product [Effrenium voratum]|uniref:Prenylcysteine lyase domain-containing protein n=1 Tax=Effrenium voratum TaxID=2562239 RepID=A0AA36I153_9DINO|nr:unnamed protein product [Effrenium voratum]